ncbi:MAG: folylpolyglutamate synthase/dihydrofolate synthase family protein [Ginsengibacter sp.]|jgi:dihydrofolate synthase/folylpolyglutamate synthase
MTYSQTLHYLYEKLPLFSRSGAKAYKADLKNTLALCTFLRNPQDQIKSVHVAGTNGKGSTSHMLAAIMAQNGYKTGLYTSPHLKDFRERIKINGAMIPQEFVVDFVEKTQDIIEEISPSFFELTFAMALDYFAHEKVDIAIIETGLGGRLDSTNVIHPLVSVITNIGLDHVDILGDTLEKIAFEKAGIIKPETPVVIGQFTKETKPVFLKKAVETHSEITFSQENYSILSAKNNHDFLDVEVIRIETNTRENYHLDLGGLYQQNNLLSVLSALEYLKDHFVMSENNIKTALANVKNLTGLHGRWEVINAQPKTVLDVAHNADGVSQLLKQISVTPFRALHLIFGMVKDKDIDTVLSLLPEKAHYYFTNAHIPRALPATELTEKASSFGLKGDWYDDVNSARKAAEEASSPEDLIVIFGSVFVVGEVEKM